MCASQLDSTVIPGKTPDCLCYCAMPETFGTIHGTIGHVCGVHSWQNRTRCRDGVKVLLCHSDLVCWFLRVPSIHVVVFIQKTSCEMHFLGRMVDQGEDGSVKYESIELCCLQRTNRQCKFKQFQVKL